MKLFEIKSLLQDMRRNKVKQDKFSFRYANIEFQVIFLIEREPYELLFGVVDHNFSFTLCLHKGFELDEMPDDVYFSLRRLMKLQKCDEVLTSYKLIQYFASRIPKKYSGKKVEPHEVAVYKQRNIPEADKIYFKGWRSHETDGRHVQNLEKTRLWLGNEAYEYCKKYNISSCWSNQPSERKTYYSPDKHREKTVL